MNSFSRCKPYLGTYVEITLASEVSNAILLEASNEAFSAIAHIDKIMSFHSRESELSFLNSNAHLRACPISSQMHQVLSLALELSSASEGYFDITVGAELVKRGLLPDLGYSTEITGNWQDIQLGSDSVSFSRELQIDLGGIAKGFAVDQVFQGLATDMDVVVNAGGDLRMSSWQDKTVTIRHPANPAMGIEVPMQNAALATSAYYYQETCPAIISPFNTELRGDCQSVSVFAESCMLADALTKVALLMPNSTELFLSFGGSVILVDEEGVVTLR